MWLCLGFCPTTTIKSAVILAPFFISITIFSNNFRHRVFVPTSELLPLRVSILYVFSTPINPLSVKALRCSLIGEKVVASILVKPCSLKNVPRLAIQLCFHSQLSVTRKTNCLKISTDQNIGVYSHLLRPSMRTVIRNVKTGSTDIKVLPNQEKLNYLLVDSPGLCALGFPHCHELVCCSLRGRWIDDAWDKRVEVHLVPLEIPARFYQSRVSLNNYCNRYFTRASG